MSEWTEWRDHDGSGCPCVGQWVEIEYLDHHRQQAIAGARGGWSWMWGDLNNKDTWAPGLRPGRKALPIIRYRIRRPRALDICRRIAALKDQPREAEPV